ncbi:Hypothetical protein PBC10988_0160 [Planctomycetales bacterium 10988]|nr:Hypothetical protein PBC10988_0160 [Planctomycetales bacterium 10988]
MSIAAQLLESFQLTEMIVKMYLEDLTDKDLLVRPVEKANHIAWQLGHLITGEHHHFSQLAPGSMPELSANFQEKHAKDKASENDPAAFYLKDEYIKRMNSQRTGTLNLLKSLSDEQLMGPSPDALHYFGKTVGSIFSGEALHWAMHAGQWAIIRRKLGKPPLF